MTTRTVRLVSLAALLPLLVVAAAGVGYDRLRCRFTGLVENVETSEMSDGERACCPVEPGPAMPIVRDARCCDRETAEVTHPPAEPSSPHATVAAPLASPLLALLPPDAPASTRAARAAKTPRAPPTPLRIAKQSFLI